MKYLKTFERLGIIQDLEQQVEGYMKVIREKPLSKVFNLYYQCDLGNYFFKLVIDPKIDSAGYFISDKNSTTGMKIYLCDREDESTLLHEVKHLDYNLRKGGSTKTIYTKSQRLLSDGSIKVSKKTLELLEHVFYIYDENEFQSKYNSFYKSFDIFLSKQNRKLTTSDIKELFYNYKLWCDDTTFSWYVVESNFNFKLENFVNKDELLVVFNYIILENKKKSFKNPYLDFFNYLVNDFKKIIKVKFKIFTDKEKEEVEKAIRFFDKDINKRIHIYKRRMSRIVALACEKYI
jgi:hypothetical protein